MRTTYLVFAAGALLTACGEGGRLSAAAIAPESPMLQVPARADGIARGIVFADRDADGVQDADEPGVPGVSVSNGLAVTRTDADGRYAIPLPPESILFVSKPVGYDVPMDPNNVPQFFYRHYPEGSADVAVWTYPVIEPTGPLPAAIDFPLIPNPVDAEPLFSALVFADTQAGTDEHESMMRADIVDELVGNPLGARFGVTVGDVVNDTLSLYPRHQAIMGAIGIPQWYLPGNHDINFNSPDDEHSLETYKRHFGPANYSFSSGNVHFLALDNVDYDGSGYIGRLSDDQLEWIRNDLAHVPNDRLLVIATHIPLITFAEGGDNINTVNLDELVAIIDGYGFDRVYGMAGHDTSNSWKVDVGHEHGFFGYSFVAHTLAEVRGAGWNTGPRDERGVRAAYMADGNPNGYYLMRFQGPTVQPKFIPASGNPVGDVRFTFDPPLEGDTSPIGVAAETIGFTATVNRGSMQPGTKLVINVFDGGERNEVSLSLDGGPFQPLTRVLRTDPFMERLFEKYAGSFDQTASPVVSSHIWEYEFSVTPEPGVHVVRLHSVDEFDQHIDAGFTFEITP